MGADNLKGLILDGPPQAGEEGHGQVVEGGGNDFSYMAEDRTWCGCALDDLDECMPCRACALPLRALLPLSLLVD